MSDDDGAKDQRTDQLTDPRTEPNDDRLIAEEVRQEFVAVTETEGDVTRGQTVGSVTEKKTFRAAAEEADEMPLPTDPKTVFLGGLFVIACMAV
ncbi:MAG: hypothetical protein QOF70_1266, partial [Acetobacteraceae bacterium]|nr:hypothetical protein [Acetobacteraceae bacterium]